MNKNVVIQVQNLSKTYKLYAEPVDRLKEALNPFGRSYHKNFYALKDVSFEIKKGETVGIIGRNGSGKSTLLKLITGVLTPSGGRVEVNGKISAILELGAGFNPEMTGLENVYLNTSINGMSKNATDEKIDDILDFAELGEFIYQPLKTYSSGMKARLGFAVAINIDPDILIVDEALAVGDAAFQRKCFAKMEQIRQAGATILFVSHSEGSIVNLCSRAIWLSNGEKIIEGEPKLVTGLYMKNSTKKCINKQEILQEIENFKSTHKQKQKEDDVLEKKLQNSQEEEYYDPVLKPKSTVYYEEKGAKISDVRITTLEGKEVNALVHGREYFYEYKIVILEDMVDATFGFLIKDMQGIAIGGGSYSLKKQENRIKIEAGTYKILWKFKCIFNARVYSLNAGCSSNKEPMHRILDAYIFRVQPIENNMFTANVNCIESVKLEQIGDK